MGPGLCISSSSMTETGGSPTPRQNRVDPFGAIHAVSARGMYMGNRGIIHDPACRTLLKRRWTTKAWIICVCAFKERQRKVMSPGTYTELFFLDEVTALAAGHRPCFECRRRAAKIFAGCFADSHRIAGPKAKEIDAVLHKQRLAAGGATPPIAIGELPEFPDGTMISISGAPAALRNGSALPWSFFGYGRPIPFHHLTDQTARLITPEATVAVLKSGYRPDFSGTAD